MSTTQIELFEELKHDTNNNFFKTTKKIRSGAPDPTPPDGSKTIFDDQESKGKGCHRGCVIS